MGRNLSKKEQTALASYFTANVLETVVVRDVPLIERPDFYKTLAASGRPLPLDFSKMAGITYIDTIVVAKQHLLSGWNNWVSLLFHECVHVCQYKLLGLNTFIQQYVQGWAANDFDYHTIPLEAQAYKLQRAFESTNQSFSVEEEVRRVFGAHKKTGAENNIV